MTRIQMIDRTDPRLGRHINHDPRSRAYAFTAPTAVLKAVEHPRHIPILDQGNLGSCTGNAAVGALGSGPLWDALAVYAPQLAGTLDEDLAVKVYSIATGLDDYAGDYPPDDTGSDGLSVAKAVVRLGFAPGYQHAFGMDAFLGALQVRPVIVGTNWHESMFWPSSSGLVTVDPASGVAGGHEYVARSFDPVSGLVGFDNSWGSGWGAEGSFFVGAGEFRELLAADGDATVFTPLASPAPIPVPAPDPGNAFDQVIAGLRRVWPAFDAWCTRHGI